MSVSDKRDQKDSQITGKKAWWRCWYRKDAGGGLLETWNCVLDKDSKQTVRVSAEETFQAEGWARAKFLFMPWTLLSPLAKELYICYCLYTVQLVAEGGNRQNRLHLESRTPSWAGLWTLIYMPSIYGNDIPTGKADPPTEEPQGSYLDSLSPKKIP